MQDNWQEFDRQIQSVLRDAEEKAPRRVWRAVSARLDSAASAALWWRWAVPALVAAALVAGVFLLGTSDRSGSSAGEISILADAGDSGIQAGASEEAETFADQAPADMSEPVMTRRAASLWHRTTAAEALKESFDTEALPEAEPSAPETDDSPALDAQDRREVQDNADNAAIAAQWARIEQEERNLRKSRVRIGGLYAQGSVGGNDSNISYGGNGISRMAPGSGSANAGISESSTSTYGVPFTLGVGVRFGLNDKLSLGTGLDYSLLTRSFNGTYSGSLAADYNGSIFHTLQYVGVPVNVYYNVLNTRDGLFDVYAWGGAEAEYCISNRYRLMGVNTVVPDTAGGFQFSVALGMGMEFKLSDRLGLYLDPAVRYYFHGNQPKSVRTDKPFMFNFDAGLRFNF